MTDKRSQARADSLADLVFSDLNAERLWLPEELGAILSHQLESPIQVDLSGIDPRQRRQLAALSSAQGLVLKSFRDLLLHPCPPIELLILAKDFAKANTGGPTASIPSDVAQALYYLSIAAAAVRCHARITTLDDPSLQRGFEWGQNQSWIEEELRSLFGQARTRFENSPKAGA